MRRWRTVFFDLDNTLYSHEYAFEKAIQACYQDLVEEWESKGKLFEFVPLEDWFDVFKYYSDLFWDPYEKKEYSQTEYRRKRFLATMKHFNLSSDEQEADDFHEQYYEKAHLYVQPYPGLYTLLDFLSSERVCIGVITNGKSKTQWQKYYKLKLYRYIVKQNFIVSDDIGVEKPAPEIFQYASDAAQSNTPPLFIGDAWELDVVGALQAGWDAIYLNTRRRPRTTKHKPLTEVFALAQLLPYFKNIYCSKKAGKSND